MCNSDLQQQDIQHYITIKQCIPYTHLRQHSLQIYTNLLKNACYTNNTNIHKGFKRMLNQQHQNKQGVQALVEPAAQTSTTGPNAG